MAGYVMTIGDLGSMKRMLAIGAYSTRIKTQTKQYWNVALEATLADYVTMKTGDLIFFFHKRKIYGIGRLVAIGYDCKLLNFPGANVPQTPPEDTLSTISLFNRDDSPECYRWICTFTPCPAFFSEGVDMDDVLSSNPEQFRMLRVFQGRSFIKLPNREAEALEAIVLRRNEQELLGIEGDASLEDMTLHLRLQALDTKPYQIDAREILDLCANENGSIRHEMAIECALLQQISEKYRDTINIFGDWDYLSHQVAASPFKPIAYMDSIDIFGYRNIRGHQAISKYLVCEIKKDSGTANDVDQLMKYVDWVASEYCGHDYSQIHAFLVAFDFADETLQHRDDRCSRGYTIGSHPTEPKEWNELRLVKYIYRNRNLEFSVTA